MERIFETKTVDRIGGGQTTYKVSKGMDVLREHLKKGEKHITYDPEVGYRPITTNEFRRGSGENVGPEYISKTTILDDILGVQLSWPITELEKEFIEWFEKEPPKSTKLVNVIKNFFKRLKIRIKKVVAKW